MDIFWSYFVIVVRIFTIFPLLLSMTLFMGRRSVGELPVFDFLIILSLGSVVGADIAEPDIAHLPTAFAVVVIALLQKTVAVATVKIRSFGRLVTFEPIVMVHEGVVQFQNLRRAKYSVDNILQMLREEQVFDIALVHLAVLEANGKLSVMLRPVNTPVTTGQLGLEAEPADIAYPVVIEGRLQPSVLAYLKLTDEWIYQQLQSQSAKLEDVFLGSVNKDKQLALHLYVQWGTSALPPIRH